MHPKLLNKCFAKPAEIFTTLLILLLSVFIVQMVALGIEMVITIHRTNEWTTHIPNEPKELTIQEKINRSDKECLPDGTILLVYNNYNRTKGGTVTQIYDVNNNLIWEGTMTYDENNKQIWKGINDAPMPSKGYLRWNSNYEDRGYQSAEWFQKIKPDFSETLAFKSNSDKEVWRYDFYEGCFTGYTYDREIIGYIGLNGFVKNKAEIKPFGKLMLWNHPRQIEDEQQPTSPVILITNNQVCLLNMANRKVDVVLNTEGSRIKKSCLGDLSTYVPVKTSTIKYRPVMDFVTEDDIHHLLLREPEQALNVSLPKDCLGKIEDIAFTATENDIFFKITITDESLSSTHRREYRWFEEYNSKEHNKWIGLYKVNQNNSLELVNRYEWTSPAIKRKDSMEPRQKSKPFVTAFSPPPYDWLWRRYNEYISNYYYADSIPMVAIVEIIKESRPLNMPFNLIISLAIMGFTLWHGWARRTSWLKLVFWIVFTGLFGLAGMLTYWALNHTPVIKCPLCGKSRGLERSNCVRCGLKLPRPERRKLDLILNS